MGRQMKDSEIEWIGEVPSTWTVKKAKTVFCQRNTRGNKEEVLLSPTQKFGVIPQSQLEGVVKVKEETDLQTFKTIHKGDFVISLRSFQGGFEYSKFEGVCSPAYQVFYPTDTISDVFFKYLFKSHNFISKMNNLTVGIREGKNIQYKDFANSLIAVPPLEEQHRIATYLDAHCSEIDNILEKTRASVEEYKKLKQVVITQAVTKGVRGERPMKDSGIEWIGEIPEEWKSAKLKYCTYIRARLGWKGLKADEYVDEGYPLLSAFNIINSKLSFESVNYINEFRYNESPEIKISKSDILLVKDGAGIGKCAIVEELPLESTVNGSIAVVTVEKHLEPKYLYYYFLSELFQQYIDRIKGGMGVPHLFQSDLKEIKVAFSDIDEQSEIVSFLDEKCKELDKIITKKEQLLTELENYKKSLIYECVTGKMEV